MFRSLRFRLASRTRLGLAVGLLAVTLSACGSSPPPTMKTVKKLVAEDRTFDALATLIPLAQSGDPEAQYELAGFYHYGYVGANDYAKALKWYRAAARQGYADAMVGLAVMYLGGQGVAQDRREAFVWLNLAAQYMTDQHALAKIKRIRDDIGKNLTKDDIAFAKAESMLLQPESASVQPNEAESIDHLPDTVPPAAPAATPTVTPTVTGEPLQNVPPDTAPLGDIPLQNAPPAPPAATVTAPSTALPATTATQPSEGASTTAPATPVVPPPATDSTPSGDATDTPSSPDVKPVPEF